MQFHFGNVPAIEGFQPEAEGLQRIGGPKGRMSILLASVAGLALLVLVITPLCLILSYFALPGTEDPASRVPGPWQGVVLALLLYIPLHELLHLVLHPGMGRTNQSILVIWPKKLQFGVYYEGCMSRGRWLMMRAAPFVALSLIPAVFLGLFQYVPINHIFRTFLEVTLVVNVVGCGADVAAMWIVARQVPRSGVMCFRGGRAYWKGATAAT